MTEKNDEKIMQVLLITTYKKNKHLTHYEKISY